MTNHDRTTRFLDEYERFKAVQPTPDWLHTIHESGMSHLRSVGLPTSKDEQWRFTDIASLFETSFRLPDAGMDDAAPTGDMIETFGIPNLEGHVLLLVNGKLARRSDSCDNVPEGVEIRGLAESVAAGARVAGDNLSRYARFNGNPFVALNTAFIADGAYIRIPDGVALDRPIQILHVIAGGACNIVSYPRTLIVVGDGSEVTVVERYVTAAGSQYFTNAVGELTIGHRSRVNLYKLQQERSDAFHIGSLSAHVGADSYFNSHVASAGAALSRHDIHVTLDDERAECRLNGLYLGRDRQVVDNHTRIDHTMPNCNSYELYKGILDDRSRGVFNGKIHVHPDAQKTDAKQTNRALLLSDDARVNTKPELEIYADDVKCTHGATIGQLDDAAVFYLRSRGISREGAHAILTQAFAGEAIANVTVEPLRKHMESVVSEWLA